MYNENLIGKSLHWGRFGLLNFANGGEWWN